MVLQTKEQLAANSVLSARLGISPKTEVEADALLKEIEAAWELLKIPGTYHEFLASSARTTLQVVLETQRLPVTDALIGAAQFASIIGFKLGMEAARQLED